MRGPRVRGLPAGGSRIRTRGPSSARLLRGDASSSGTAGPGSEVGSLSGSPVIAFRWCLDDRLADTGEAPPSERTLYWRMANRSQRAVRRGDWKYLKIRDTEYLFDIGYDPRERGNMARKRPDLLNELRGLWEDWNRGMLPVPDNMVPPFSNLQEMLW